MRGKKIWGRKRCILVDTLGLLLAVVVYAGSRQERDGAKRLLSTCLREAFPRLLLIWADQGYAGSPLRTWVQAHLGCQLEIVKPPQEDGSWVWRKGKLRWKRGKSKGFQIIPKRWVVERTFAWITRCRRLARDYEGLPTSSEAFIKLCAIRRMVVLLAPPFS